ncbi:TPA: MipA/OmpV family protein, partial [Pasteurella multocida]|nr:MipA/OmpV family protein [Pasteurella multocida]
WETYSKAIKKSPIVKRSGEISSALNFYYMF